MKISKKNVALAVVSLILTVVSIVLCVYYKGGLSEYSSILDRYLHFGQINILMFSAVFMMLSAVFWGIFLAVTLVRIKKNTTKKPVIVCVVFAALFVLANAGTWVGIVAGQQQEDTVVDFVADTAAHVDFTALFGTPDDATYHEQMNQKKTCDEIPVHYEIQQSDAEYFVQTACTELVDADTRTAYYEELQTLYADYGIQPFDADTADALGIVKGFYYTIDQQTLGVVVIKEDKVFNISIDGMTALSPVLMQQIAAL